MNSISMDFSLYWMIASLDIRTSIFFMLHRIYSVEFDILIKISKPTEHQILEFWDTTKSNDSYYFPFIYKVYDTFNFINN